MVDRARGLDARLEGDRHPGGEHGIEKRPGVTHQDPAIARVAARPEGEVLLHPHRPLAARVAHERGDGRRLLDRVLQKNVRSHARHRVEGLSRKHHPDTHECLRDGNEPEPAEVVTRDDPDVARPAPLSPWDTRIVGEGGDVGEPGFIDAKAELARQETEATRGVHDRGRPRFLRAAEVVAEAHIDARRIEGGLQHPVALSHVGSAGGGMAQEKRIELGSRNLPRLGPRDLRGNGEVGEPLDRAVGRHEGRPPLGRKRLRAHEVVGANFLEHVVHRGQERFADVKARKAVTLEQDDTAARPRETTGGR